MQIGQAVADKLATKYNLEDVDVSDNGDGKVIVFAVSDDFINLPVAPNEVNEGLPKGFWDKKMKAKDEVDESYATLVNKIKKQGKSEKTAKAIAGAIASYKLKGGGKGPTVKQK
jgi:hypothetical protein